MLDNTSLSTAFGPDLMDLGEHALVPFEVGSLKSARILWRNDRFWTAQGFDTGNAVVSRDLDSMILDRYAYIVPTPDTEGFLSADRKTVFADRYGSSSGGPYGGSGRTAVFSGGINVKGVGRTPLAAAPSSVDLDHSHGCAWAGEAVQEAVLAELAREFPNGAIPVAAIIDTGIDVSVEQWHFVGRRVLILRPNFVRPAHFQRSLYFGTAGTAESDQYLDVLRTRDAIRNVWGDALVRRKLGIRSQTFVDSMERVFQQIAYCYVHRLFLGGISSSNICVDGEIVDFGGFTSVHSWRKTYFNDKLPAFGDDDQDIGNMLQSLVFFLLKYYPEGPALDEGLARRHDVINRAFFDYLREALGIGEGERAEFDPILEHLALYFVSQKKSVDALYYKGRRRWLYRHLTHAGGDPGDEEGAATLRKILVHLDSVCDGRPVRKRRFLSALMRLTLPRYRINWGRLNYRCRRLVDRHLDAPDIRERVEAFLNGVLTESFRVWRFVNADEEVVAQAHNGACDYVLTRDPASAYHLYRRGFGAGEGDHPPGTARIVRFDVPAATDTEARAWCLSQFGLKKMFTYTLWDQGHA